MAYVKSNQASETDEYSDSESEIEDLCIKQYTAEGMDLENCDALIRPGIVHRLDKGTSGLLVVAKVSRKSLEF